MNSGTTDIKATTGNQKVNALKAAQDRADTRRFEKEERERKDREAAQAAAQAAANARATQAARRYQPSGGGGGDGGGSSNSSIATQIQAQNPSLSRGEALSAAAKTKSYSSNTGGYDEAPSVAAGHASGGKQKEDYGFGDAYNYKTGGLVSMPAAKKQKKRTTQRRKGLGTRP